jgi:hypothetical protein
MTWQRAWAYLAAFVALGVYYVASEPRALSRAPELPSERPFLDAPADEVAEITLQRGETSVHCVRDGNRWRVERPSRSRAPSDLIAALVAQLTEFPGVAVVDQRGEQPDQYGLDPPESKIRIKLRGGRTIGVAIGSRNPAKTAVYAQVLGKAPVVLVGLNVLYYQDLIIQQASPAAE